MPYSKPWIWHWKYTKMEEVQQKKSLLKAARWPFYILLLMWALEIIKHLTGIQFGNYGILPRYMTGLKGIITAPLIHGSYGHLFNNSLPFLVGATLIIYFYQRVSFAVISLIWILTGALVWIFAKPAYHIGASGVVYGMISFIFWAGVFNRDRQSIVLSLIILFLYSGMFYGVLPDQPGVSWESHLLGGMVGILAAYLFRTPKEEEPWDDDESPRPYFREDTFKQTGYWN